MTRASERVARYTRAQVDAKNAEVLGIATRQKIEDLQTLPFSRYAIKQAIRVITGAAEGGTHLGELIAGWAKLDNPTGRGRPTSISSTAFLTLMLAHAIAGEGLTMTGMSYTAARRLSPKQWRKIGLPNLPRDADLWQGRLDSAHKVLLKRIDTYPYPTHLNRSKKLKAAELQELDRYWARDDIKAMIAVHNERLLDFMFELIANAARISSSLITDNHGDLALDATFTPILGKHTKKDHTKDARSCTPEAGLYRRNGDHYVDESRGRVTPVVTNKFGFETEIITTTVGDGLLGPDLILGIGLHRPGEISNVASELIPRLFRLGWPMRQLSVDRAYNNLAPETFHYILIQHDLDAVFDYPKDEVGKIQATYVSGMKKDKDNELVRDNRAEQNTFYMIGGQWHVKYVPELLVEAVAHSYLDKSDPRWISEAQLEKRIETLDKYRLVPFGKPDEDGYQRYLLPDPTGYLPIDPNSGEFQTKPKAKTVTIPLSVGARWQQKYPHKSRAWREAYNLRSTVERTNNLLKHPTLGGLADPNKRPFAGYTAHALAVAMLAAAHNVQAANFYLIANDPDITLLKNRHIQTRPKQRPLDSRIETPKNPRRRRAA